MARCLNPANHSDSPEAAAKYRVEPYVVAADIYSEAPNVGRGGWSWYTGAAAWTYRLVVEVMLGIRRRGDAFEISPCLPSAWEGYQARLRLDGTEYQIRVVREGAQQYRIYVNDELLPDGRLAIATRSAQSIDAHAETLDGACAARLATSFTIASAPSAPPPPICAGWYRALYRD